MKSLRKYRRWFPKEEEAIPGAAVTSVMDVRTETEGTEAEVREAPMASVSVFLMTEAVRDADTVIRLPEKTAEADTITVPAAVRQKAEPAGKKTDVSVNYMGNGKAAIGK